jgi:quinol monooxygenase YgiN
VILSLIELKPANGKRQDLLDVLQYSMIRLLTNPECLNCGVYESTDGDGSILYLEQWTSEESLRRHIQSNHYLAVLNALDLASEPRRINFHEVAVTKSMEFVATLRGSGPC